MNIRSGHITFDHADYDAGNDVLYLHVGDPRRLRARRLPRVTCSAMHWVASIVGLTVLGAQTILDNEGELRVTIPEPVKASAGDLAPALAAI